jgi:seryl-tRNA synthetase
MSDTQTLNRDLTLEALFEAGLFIDTGTAGLHGRSGAFEAVVNGLEALITHPADGAEVMRFPPAMGRKHFAKSGYFKNFPHLSGCVHSFCGTEKDHAGVLKAMNNGEAWGEDFAPTEVVLTPAACYPLYPMTAARGPLPHDGALYDVQSFCFRHEPSQDPGRLQMFRQREYVRIGTAEQVLAFRALWLTRSQAMMQSLDLPHTVDVANDPFFGRAGKLMAASQREHELKFELLAPIASSDNPTACVSFNYHQQYFGLNWGIVTEDGAPAHTACVGFGLERTALALMRRHGLKPASWPVAVKDHLQL